MTATPRDYAVGTAVLEKVVQGDIDADVPALWRGMIPTHLVPDLGAQGARAVIDALYADWAKRGLVLVQKTDS